MKFNLTFTEKEFDVLIKHWQKNLDFGWDGTFGGYADDDKEYKREKMQEGAIAKKILLKLIRAETPIKLDLSRKTKSHNQF